MRTKTCLHRAAVAWLLAACCLLGVGVAGAQAPSGAQAPARQTAPQAHSGPIILIGQMTVKAGRVQDFIRLVAQMKARVQTQDHGNIRYELFRVAPRPGAAGAPGDERSFYFLEEWRDQAAAAAHGKWAGPIVRTQWREMTDSMQLVRVDRLPLR